MWLSWNEKALKPICIFRNELETKEDDYDVYFLDLQTYLVNLRGRSNGFVEDE